MTTPAQFSRARVDVLRAVLNEAEAHGLTKLELAEILSGEAASLIRKARASASAKVLERCPSCGESRGDSVARVISGASPPCIDRWHSYQA
jgi:hypothetical protein